MKECIDINAKWKKVIKYHQCEKTTLEKRKTKNHFQGFALGEVTVFGVDERRHLVSFSGTAENPKARRTPDGVL